MKKIYTILILAFASLSCEKEIELDIRDSEQNIVVEGYMENGRNPVVILSRDASLQETGSFIDIGELYIRNAQITVSDGERSVELVEVKENDPKVIGNLFQLPADFLDLGSQLVDFYYYTTRESDSDFRGEIGKKYTLNIDVEGQKVSGNTVIPSPPLSDSIFYQINDEIDTLARVFLRVVDPAGEKNYYRYFTSRNEEPFYPGTFASVADDQVVDGTSFNFPLDRAQAKSQPIEDPQTFGFFSRGDSVSVKFCTLPATHYTFWNTLETNLRNVGNPFGGITLIESNIEGGNGIWGGQACRYNTIIIE